MSDPSTRTLLTIGCHASVFLTSTLAAIAIPLVILLVSTDPVVKENAKEALNFQISLILYALICILLIFVLIGVPLLILLGIANLILPIIAIVRVIERPDQPYRYPFIFRLV